MVHSSILWHILVYYGTFQYTMVHSSVLQKSPRNKPTLKNKEHVNLILQECIMYTTVNNSISQ